MLARGSCNTHVDAHSAMRVMSCLYIFHSHRDATSDKLIKTYTDHDDSIYSISWSSCDAWCFASLSYDGRVVVNQVPAAEKYKILL